MKEFKSIKTGVKGVKKCFDGINYYRFVNDIDDFDGRSNWFVEILCQKVNGEEVNPSWNNIANFTRQKKSYAKDLYKYYAKHYDVPQEKYESWLYIREEDF